MEEIKKGAETPKIEKVKTLDEELETMTAKEAMNFELEEIEEKGLGCSILDRQNLKVPNIIEVHEKREKIRELFLTLPNQTVCWVIQRYDIYDRISQTKFFEWYDSKKELTYNDYTELERILNKEKDGISLSELAVLTDKSKDELFKDLRAGCGLSIISNIVNSSCTEFIMENDLYVRLIPLVNENNQLTDKIRTQYLLKSNALQYLAEYWGNGDIVDTCC